jgi:hypothetical protein
VDIYKSNRETALGYYFIKYLADMKNHRYDVFNEYKVKLPNQMPPYISPQHVMQKVGGNAVNTMNTIQYPFVPYQDKLGLKQGLQTIPGPYAF